MTLQEFKNKYFFDNFYWVNKNNYKKLQEIALKVGCLCHTGKKEMINWHEGFKNLGFRTHESNKNITVFQKESFLMQNEIATNFNKMLNDYKNITTCTKQNSINKEQIGKVVFSKELFIETINEIEKQHRHDSKCSEAFKIILPNDYVSNYANHYLQNQLIKIIQIAMNDNYKHSWIEYYIYDLNFGSEYSKGCIKIKGKNFELKTASDLWNLLNGD